MTTMNNDIKILCICLVQYFNILYFSIVELYVLSIYVGCSCYIIIYSNKGVPWSTNPWAKTLHGGDFITPKGQLEKPLSQVLLRVKPNVLSLFSPSGKKDLNSFFFPHQHFHKINNLMWIDRIMFYTQ